MIIAIDGPAGSGKSTIAKLLAKRLDFLYLDTGAMYRAVADEMLHRKLKVDQVDELVGIAEKCPITFVHHEDDADSVLIHGRDVTQSIRSAEVNAVVSQVACIAEVREALLEQQRVVAQNNNIVAEGRDIGSVVFPHAELKVYLTADPKVRAKRRAVQMLGAQASDENKVAEVLESLLLRDEMDTSRKAAPLRAAEDSVTIDSTDMSTEQVLDRLEKLAVKRNKE